MLLRESAFPYSVKNAVFVVENRTFLKEFWIVIRDVHAKKAEVLITFLNQEKNYKNYQEFAIKYIMN